MLLVNQNNVVDAKSVNASLIALKNQADKLNRQIITLEKSIKSLDSSKADEKDLSNYYTKDETYNKTEVYNTSEITNNYYNKQSVDRQISNALVRYTKFSNINYLGITSADDLLEGNYVANNLTNGISGWATYYTTKVDNGTSYMIQRAIHINGGCYVRYKHANVWGTWRRLATEEDLKSITWDNGTTWTSINTNVCNGSNLYNLYIKHGNSIMYQLTGWIRVKAGTYSAGTKVFDLPHKAKINTYLHGAKNGIVSPEFYQLYVDNNKTEVVFNQPVTFSAETVIQFNTLICTTDN